MWERNCSLRASDETAGGFSHTQAVIALLLRDLLRLLLYRAPPFTFFFFILITNYTCQYHSLAPSVSTDCSKDKRKALSNTLAHSHGSVFASRVPDSILGTGEYESGQRAACPQGADLPVADHIPDDVVSTHLLPFFPSPPLSAPAT